MGGGVVQLSLVYLYEKTLNYKTMTIRTSYLLLMLIYALLITPFGDKNYNMFRYHKSVVSALLIVPLIFLITLYC